MSRLRPFRRMPPPPAVPRPLQYAALINPAGYTSGHPSLVAAIAQVSFPTYEVHISSSARRGGSSEIARVWRGDRLWRLWVLHGPTWRDRDVTGHIAWLLEHRESEGR